MSFAAQVFQNEFLPDGGTDMHAIVRISCDTQVGSGEAANPDQVAEVIMIDRSGSMGSRGVREAVRAAQAALAEMPDGILFAVVQGNHLAQTVFPGGPRRFAVMNPVTRNEAGMAMSGMFADGGTAMGTWLTEARMLFDTAPQTLKRHAILLTDGVNEHETPAALEAAIRSCTGVFQCDCRGVGDQWEIAEVRKITTALLGTVDLIRTPEEMAAEFAAMIRTSVAKGVTGAELRVWVPQGAQLLSVEQVAPQLENLTARRREVNPLTGAYPTGAWGPETRDYKVAVRLPAKAIGQEQLAARVQIAVGDQILAQGLAKAKWSADESLTARIDPAVAEYTGKVELAKAIQEGLEAKSAGRDAEATTKLGRAVQLAAAGGDEEMTAKLRKVVEIDDAAQGTVRLKRSTSKMDEMSLDTASTKTSRVKR